MFTRCHAFSELSTMSGKVLHSRPATKNRRPPTVAAGTTDGSDAPTARDRTVGSPVAVGSHLLTIRLCRALRRSDVRPSGRGGHATSPKPDRAPAEPLPDPTTPRTSPCHEIL